MVFAGKIIRPNRQGDVDGLRDAWEVVPNGEAPEHAATCNGVGQNDDADSTLNEADVTTAHAIA
jgi:hypothetical protein